MEYTKDMFFQVNYGQVKKKERFQFLGKIVERIMKHKIISIIICMTFMLSILDFMLVSSFVNILSSI